MIVFKMHRPPGGRVWEYCSDAQLQYNRTDFEFDTGRDQNRRPLLEFTQIVSDYCFIIALNDNEP